MRELKDMKDELDFLVCQAHMLKDRIVVLEAERQRLLLLAEHHTAHAKPLAFSGNETERMRYIARGRLFVASGILEILGETGDAEQDKQEEPVDAVQAEDMD